MGLKPAGLLSSAVILFGFASVAGAAPMLRLAATTVGPVTVPTGANGTTQTVEAYNAGDSAMALSLASSVTWLAPTVGAARACSTTTAATTCLPLQFALNTASLTAATYTGIVTVSDPNTVDAPQTITVTVTVGSTVPSSVTAYVQPGNSADVAFTTNSKLAYSVKTNDGAQWLSLVLDGVGSFRFVWPYHIHMDASHLALGSYSGTLTTGQSTYTDDNKTIPVSLMVTSQAIAQATPDHLTVRLAQGAPPLYQGYPPYSATISLGTGVTAQSVTATGGAWLTATVNSGVVSVSIDPGSLTPGTYNGSLNIASNAANSPATVPVAFQVVAKGPPLIYYQGVVDNGTYIPGDTVAQGDIVVVKGEQFGSTPLVGGQAPPLATQIQGTSVLVNGKPAPLYYAWYGQIAFQMPVDAPLGTNLVQVQLNGVTSNTVSVNVASRAPRLLLIGVGSYGAIVNNLDGSLPLPTGPPLGAFQVHPAHVGDILTIYAIGLGPTSPTVPSGQPAPSGPYANLTVTPEVNFGESVFGTRTSPSFVGMTPTSAGLYQINVQIPPGFLGRGTVPVNLYFNDGTASNAVNIEIQ